MTYKDRKDQLIQTLKSIKKSVVKDYEIIIVDDASNDDQRIEDLVDDYNINLIRIDQDKKTWTNPCIPYNMAFNEAKGDKIIIQNSECAHIGDVLSVVEDNLVDNMYINFGCLSYPENLTKKLAREDYFETKDGSDIKTISSGIHQAATGAGQLAWYNHSMYNARVLHFCSAITKSDLDKSGGFDERFVDGYNFDDNEFIWRLNERDMKIIIVNDPFVIHQWHYDSSYILNDPQHEQKILSNQEVFRKIVEKEIPRWDQLKAGETNESV
jgi:GT2 family glycosyltransferase